MSSHYTGITDPLDLLAAKRRIDADIEIGVLVAAQGRAFAQLRG